MNDRVIQPDGQTLDNFLRAQAKKLRQNDRPPATRKAWEERRQKLIARLREAMGPVPEKDCDLEPRILGTLKRDGYRIEKLIFQSRPDVWVTASAYVPEGVTGKVPAVLAVHGHWAGARRDPAVQARCLGLVKLGFFVLAVDAFGSGERYTQPARGTYHGALYGATLWPTGHTLLGMQVHDNRRAVDYLCSRPEVDPKRLGITGASGGGNQSMYAGALDERFAAVVPVCSVGTYQAYLHAACCVCEVLPGALTFTEEGDVLGLVAPRALMVISATKDAFQFSVGEAKKSLARAEAIFGLLGAGEKIKHAIFESPHDYNRPMREAMYGWMTRWLKGEGKGEPIAEPAHKVDSAEDLACFPNPEQDRPKGFLTVPAFAGRQGRGLLRQHEPRPDHQEAWEARSMMTRETLREVAGFIAQHRPDVDETLARRDGDIEIRSVLVPVEPGVSVRAQLEWKAGGGKRPERLCVLLHLDGMEPARKHPLRSALLEEKWSVLLLELRGTGAAAPKGDVVRAAPDHNSTEHALWVGRPLLGQWLTDVIGALVLREQAPRGTPLALVGIGQAGLLAVSAAAFPPFRSTSVVTLDSPVSYVTDRPYADGTRMGLLAPGLLRAGDVPHLAALAAPQRLQIIGGVSPSGERLKEKDLLSAYSYTRSIYDLHRGGEQLIIKERSEVKDIVTRLGDK